MVPGLQSEDWKDKICPEHGLAHPDLESSICHHQHLSVTIFITRIIITLTFVIVYFAFF